MRFALFLFIACCPGLSSAKTPWPENVKTKHIGQCTERMVTKGLSKKTASSAPVLLMPWRKSSESKSMFRWQRQNPIRRDRRMIGNCTPLCPNAQEKRARGYRNEV